MLPGVPQIFIRTLVDKMKSNIAKRLKSTSLVAEYHVQIKNTYYSFIYLRHLYCLSKFNLTIF
jgi:hypothetical protein